MSKGSGGGRSAVASPSSKSGTKTESSGGKYNTDTYEGMGGIEVNPENLKEMQSRADKGQRIIPKDSTEFMDPADAKGYKVKPGDYVVPKSDPRTPYAINNDTRPSKDFAPINQKVKGDPYAESIGQGSRKAIEPAKKEFNDSYNRAKRLRDTARDFERAGATKQAENFKNKMRKERITLLRLGEKIVNFEHKAGRTAGTAYEKGFREFL